VKRIEILGVAFDNLTRHQAVERALALLEEPGLSYVVTPNAEIVQNARQNDGFRALLNGADLVLPDGVGVLKAAQMLKKPLQERVAGVDFAGDLMARLAGTEHKVFLLGAKPGVADLAAANLRNRYPGLVVAGTHDGYFTQDESVIRAVAKSGADVLFVCMGSPRQEQWIVRCARQTGVRLAAGLGGSLDVWAGTVQRAPEVWQKAGLEWLYRTIKEPKRIGRVAKLPGFLVAAWKDRSKESRE